MFKDIIIINNIMFDSSPDRKPKKNIEELIEMAGNAHKYQRDILILFILQFLFSAFI